MRKQIILLVAGWSLQSSALLLAQSLPGTILWTFNIGSQFSPAVSPDGTIYLSNAGLCAITNAGSSASNKWCFPAAITSTPAIGADGTIYFGAYDGFYAVNTNGTQRWFYSLPSKAGAPAISFDETIYFQSGGFLYALSASGNLQWKSEMTFPGEYSAPSIGLDGTIYVGSSDEPRLYAFRPDSSRKWVRQLSTRPVGDSPVVGGDGTIYVTFNDLYAFTPEGTNIWRAGSLMGHSFMERSPVIAKDGTLFIVSNPFPYPLTRVTSSGVVSLTSATESISHSSPKCAAIDAGGTIWYCASNTVWALDGNGLILPWSQVIDDGYFAPEASPVIGPDGTLFTARGGRLYAIATGTNGPADSPWPMYRGNARHTGKIEKPALKQPKKRADANFEFQLYAQLGQTNTVEATTNLNTWTSLTSIVVTTVPQPVVDLTASNHPARFYRSTAP